MRILQGELARFVFPKTPNKLFAIRSNAAQRRWSGGRKYDREVQWAPDNVRCIKLVVKANPSPFGLARLNSSDPEEEDE